MLGRMNLAKLSSQRSLSISCGKNFCYFFLDTEELNNDGELVYWLETYEKGLNQYAIWIVEVGAADHGGSPVATPIC